MFFVDKPRASSDKTTRAFIDAVTSNDVDAAKRALDTGADVDACIPADGRYPTGAGRWASKSTPMLGFVARGNKQWLGMLELLIEQGRSRGNRFDRGGELGRKKDKTWGVPRKATYTPLYAAAMSNDLRAVEVLLAAGADPNTGRIKDTGTSTRSATRSRPRTGPW